MQCIINCLIMLTVMITRPHPFVLPPQPTSQVDLNPVKCWVWGPAAKFRYTVVFRREWRQHGRPTRGDLKQPGSGRPHSQHEYPDGWHSRDKHLPQQPRHARTTSVTEWTHPKWTTAEWTASEWHCREWLHNRKVNNHLLRPVWSLGTQCQG